MASVLTGLIPGDRAFQGFGHPAVITVACVLILGYGLKSSGAVDVLARKALPATSSVTVSITSLTAMGAFLSAFMNNVGALALLMPVAIQVADRHKIPHGKVLMPLAFGSILGGITTLIGTPPNLIISGFRAQAGLGHYSMFDFSPVGLSVALSGVAFIGLIGWRLVPERAQLDPGAFQTGAYLSEFRIVDKSKAIGKTFGEIEELLGEGDFQIIGLVHRDFHIRSPHRGYRIEVGDILVVEAEPKSISQVLSRLGLKLEEDISKEDNCVSPHCPSPSQAPKTRIQEDDIVIQELVALPDSVLVGRSVRDIQLRTRYGINLLAISRQGRNSIKRLRSTAIKGGDLLLMHGTPGTLASFAANFDCLPLAPREIPMPKKGQAIKAGAIMALAVGIAALGLLPASVSFALGVLAYVVMRIVPLRSVYTAVDWPVIVLLGAMLPVAGAMASTGTADVIARQLMDTVARGNPVAGLVATMVATMMLTDFMNNAAAAAVMAPIGLSTAIHLGVSPDPFLMAVAIGSSCAFLTPIGHQNNTLILGPGGFSFGDYWPMGLPTDLIAVSVAVPMLLLVWPM